MTDVVRLPGTKMYELRSVDAQGRRIVALIDDEAYSELVRKGRIKPNNQPPPGPMANTTGIIVPATSPNASGAGNSAPPPQPPEEKKGWWKSWGSDVTHGVLDVVGMVPVIGEPFNLVGAGVYAAEGDYISAGLDLAAMWPAGGQAATAAKYGVKGGKAVAKEAEQKAAKELEEQAAKKAAKGAEEKAAKKEAEAAGGGKDGGHIDKPPKKKLKCGDAGSYKNLKKKTGGGKFDRDHIPSKAALKARAEAMLGQKLTPKQAKAIDGAADTIAIPREAHVGISPTYGQSTAEAAKDATNLAGSAQRDIAQC